MLQWQKTKEQQETAGSGTLYSYNLYHMRHNVPFKVVAAKNIYFY